MFGFEFFQFVLEMLDVLFFALPERPLACSVLGAPSLRGRQPCLSTQFMQAYAGLGELTMRMFEAASLSCAVLERLRRRSSCWTFVRSVNSMELMVVVCGWRYSG